MTDLLKTIQALMMDPNAMTRLYAIDLLVQNQHRFEADTVVDVLQNATNDREDEVAQHAKLAMSKLLQWGFSGEDKLRELGIHSRMTDLSEIERIKETEVRRAGLDVLAPVLTAVRSLVPNHPLAPQALLTLGELRDASSVGLIVDSLSNPTLRDRAFEALQNFRTPEVRALMGRLLEREKDDAMVARSADVLGEMESLESLAALQGLVVSPSEVVRERVAVSLGKVPRRAGEETLLKMWESERGSSVQLAILSSLGRTGRDGAVEAIGRRLGAITDEKVLSKAMMALGQIGSIKGFSFLANALNNEHARVRANALEGIARLPMSATEVVPLVEPYLRDKNNRVRGNAVMAIFPHDHRRALDELRRMMSSDRPPDRATAAWIASQIQNIEAVEALVILTNTELDKMVQQSCLTAIDQLRNPRVRPVLQRLLAHPSTPVRLHAIAAYARVGGPPVLRELEVLYQQSDSELVKGAIVTAMGGISHQGNLTFLQRKLGESSERVVANAIEALDHVGGLEVAVMVGPFAGHANPRVRANAITVLWNLGHIQDATALARMLASKDEASQRSALFALAGIARNFAWREMEKRPLLLSVLTERLSEGQQEDLNVTIGIDLAPVSVDDTEDRELSLVQALKALSEYREDAVAARLRKLLERDPADAHAHFLLSRLTASGGERHVPPDGVAEEGKFLYLLAEKLKIAKSGGDIEAVLETYFKIFSLHLELLQEFVEQGRAYLGRGDGGGAGVIARFIVSQLQWTEDLHRRLGMIYLANKDFARAHEQLWKACLNTPEEGGALLELARSAVGLDKRKLAGAIAELVLSGEHIDPRVKSKAARFAERLAKVEGGE